MTPTVLAEPEFESLMHLDASAGLDATAPAHVEHIYRGDQAVVWNLQLTSTGRAEAERSLRDYWRGDFPWIAVKSVDFSYDDAHRVIRLSMDGSATMDWTKDTGVRDFQLADSSLGFDPSFEREPGPNLDAPFAVPFPIYRKWTDVIVLPGKGASFGLLYDGDVDRTVAERRYQRRSRIENGVVTMVSTEQTLGPEFPAAEASADAIALRQLNQTDVDVRWGSSTAAAANEPGDDDLPLPTDAAGFAYRAANYVGQRDFAKAIADLDQAVRLDPSSAKYLYDRGAARFDIRQDDQALADFNAALRRNRNNEMALPKAGERDLS